MHYVEIGQLHPLLGVYCSFVCCLLLVACLLHTERERSSRSLFDCKEVRRQRRVKVVVNDDRIEKKKMIDDMNFTANNAGRGGDHQQGVNTLLLLLRSKFERLEGHKKMTRRRGDDRLNMLARVGRESVFFFIFKPAVGRGSGAPRRPSRGPAGAEGQTGGRAVGRPRKNGAAKRISIAGDEKRGIRRKKRVVRRAEAGQQAKDTVEEGPPPGRRER